MYAINLQTQNLPNLLAKFRCLLPMGCWFIFCRFQKFRSPFHILTRLHSFIQFAPLRTSFAVQGAARHAKCQLEQRTHSAARRSILLSLHFHPPLLLLRSHVLSLKRITRVQYPSNCSDIYPVLYSIRLKGEDQVV